MCTIQFLLIQLLYLCFSSPLTIASTTNIYRLPTSINPIQYTVTLKPNFVNFTFNGFEQISINISQTYLNNNEKEELIIEMHIGPQIKISKISLIIESYNNKKHINTTQQSYNNETQIISFKFNVLCNEILNTLSNNILGTLNIDFNGILRDDMKGFYISKYTYENTTIYNAVTQFESTDARRAFPCFDEPSFKSHFQITMIAPEISTVLSNMNISNMQSLDMNEHKCEYTVPISMNSNGITTQCKMVQFETSPLMSPYLVAFAVGLYNNVTNYTKNGLKTSIYFPIDSDSNHAKYALNAAIKVLPFYEQLFGVQFPLPKMDCLALSDFSAGAMENWGLVTYRRTALLVDPLVSSKAALQRVVVVIAHEFAHQWFGDIVTMKWWNDLWLNEGFASFVEYIGTDYVDDEFEIWDFFSIYMNSVLSIDSSFYTHPIELSVNNPNEIDTLFDSVTYDKGMSVIRMLYNFMGKDIFMSGIQSYLSLYKYNNADTQQLWDSLGGENIINMMNTWVLQSGFPYLNVAIIENNNDNNIVFNVKQKRMIKQGPLFFNNYDAENDNYSLKYDMGLINEYNKQIWEIPLKIKLIDNSVQYENNVMKTVSSLIEVNKVKEGNENGYEYYLFNSDMNGFFRVLYDEELFEFIINVWLNSDKLSDFDKFSIIADQYAFMISNYISGKQYLEFLYKISKIESENPKFLIWDIIINSLARIDSLFCEKHLSNDEKYIINNFRIYAINIISPVWISINKWNITDHENDSENIINLRSLVINVMIRFNDTNTIQYGYDLFINNIMDNSDTIPINNQGELEGIDTNILRQVIECALTYEANNNENSKQLLSQFISIYDSLNSEYQQYLLRAIGAVYINPQLNVQALQFILSSNIVRNQDKLRGLVSLRRCYGRETLWQYLINNETNYWDKLFDIYGSGFSAQGLSEIPNTFASIEYYQNVYIFFYKQNGHKTLSNERSVNETIENIEININWIKNNYNDIGKYLVQVLNPDNNEDDNEASEYSVYNYIWIAILILIVLLCLTIGFRWIWKKKLSKTRMFAYKRQVNVNDTESAMIDDDTTDNNYTSL